ncbi:MAG: hypothetical protein Q7T82_05935 [Armatimonadota bacterium]|nr:hypothetical protein [Armatimonadota bacterium]
MAPLLRLLRSKFLWLLILIIASAGIAIRSLARKAPQQQAGYTVIDASKLPAHSMVGGVRLSVEKVELEGDYVKVAFHIKPSRNWDLAWDSWEGTIDGKKVDGKGWSSSNLGGGVSERGLHFRVGRRPREIDIALDLECYVSRGSTKVVFNNISPSALPITGRAGPVSVTLKKAYYGSDPAGFVKYSVRRAAGEAFRPNIRRDGAARQLQRHIQPETGWIRERQDQSGPVLEDQRDQGISERQENDRIRCDRRLFRRWSAGCL